MIINDTKAKKIKNGARKKVHLHLKYIIANKRVLNEDICQKIDNRIYHRKR